MKMGLISDFFFRFIYMYIFGHLVFLPFPGSHIYKNIHSAGTVLLLVSCHLQEAHLAVPLVQNALSDWLPSELYALDQRFPRDT